LPAPESAEVTPAPVAAAPISDKIEGKRGRCSARNAKPGCASHPVWQLSGRVRIKERSL